MGQQTRLIATFGWEWKHVALVMARERVDAVYLLTARTPNEHRDRAVRELSELARKMKVPLRVVEVESGDVWVCAVEAAVAYSGASEVILDVGGGVRTGVLCGLLSALLASLYMGVRLRKVYSQAEDLAEVVEVDLRPLLALLRPLLGKPIEMLKAYARGENPEGKYERAVARRLETLGLTAGGVPTPAARAFLRYLGEL